MPLNLVLVGLLARLLSPEDMGVYFIAFSLVTAAATLGMLGMGQTMVRVVASSIAIGDHSTARKTIKESFGWGLLGSILMALVMTIFGPQLGLPVSVILWISAWGIAHTGENLLAETMRAFSDIRTATIFQNRSITNALTVGTLLVFWIVGLSVNLQLVFASVAFISFAAVLAGIVFLWMKVNSELVSNNYQSNQHGLNLFVQALPILGINALSIVRAQVGIWIVAAFLTSEEVALYGSATRLVYLVSIPLITIVNALIPPIIAELYAKQQIIRLERTIRGLATVASIVALVLTLIFVAAGNILLDLIFGAFYVQAWPILGILAVAYLMDVASGSCGLTLMMTGHQNTLMKVTVISAALAVTLSIIGANFWGMLGVAVATAISLITQNILTIVGAKRKVGIWTHVKVRW